MRIDSGFRPLLEGFDLDALDRDASVTYGLFPDFRLGYLNAAYERFAVENGGERILTDWELGADVLSAVSGRIHDFYADAFRGVLAHGQPWEQTYHCHSPDRYRTYRMRVLPLQGGKGLLVVHSNVADLPYPEKASDASVDDARYQDENGLVKQCAHCRRVRRVAPPAGWEWVASFVAHAPSNATHTLCELCADYYYPSAPGPASIPP
jgi:hypothetical protein